MLKPKFFFEEPTDITVSFLKENNIKALMLDVDNTLTGEHKSKKLRDGVLDWLDIMRENGIKLIILSNAKTGRAKEFANSIGLDVVGMAAKPLPFGYIRAVKKLGFKRKEIAMVGDQIFTDTLGAGILGLKTVLITNITPECSLSFRIRRNLEKRILKGVK